MPYYILCRISLLTEMIFVSYQHCQVEDYPKHYPHVSYTQYNLESLSKIPNSVSTLINIPNSPHHLGVGHKINVLLYQQENGSFSHHFAVKKVPQSSGVCQPDNQPQQLLTATYSYLNQPLAVMHMLMICAVQQQLGYISYSYSHASGGF